MAKNGAQRMRELRERRKSSGLVTTTLTVPAADLHFFGEMAARACKCEQASSAESTAMLMRLRALIDAEEVQARQPRLKHFHRLHLLLAELAGNPALRLFLEIVVREFRLHNRVNQMAQMPWEAQAGARKAHRRIASAIIARDVEKARREMLGYLAATTEWIAASKDE